MYNPDPRESWSMVDHSVIDRVRHTLVHGSPGDQTACADDIR